MAEMGPPAPAFAAAARVAGDYDAETLVSPLAVNATSPGGDDGKPLASAFSGSPGVPIVRAPRFGVFPLVLGFLVSDSLLAQIKCGRRIRFREFPISAYRALTGSDGCQCRLMGDFRCSGDVVATYRQKVKSKIEFLSLTD
jgi:hypothetical protein